MEDVPHPSPESEIVHPISGPGGDVPSGLADELPALDDPFLAAPPPPPLRAQLSLLAATSLLATLLCGPLGAVAGVVFGWAARREIEESAGTRRGYALATAGMGLGLIATVAWGAAVALGVWSYRHLDEPFVPTALDDDRSGATKDPPQLSPPAPRSDTPPGGSVPKETVVYSQGTITVVDVGVSVRKLVEELAHQRAQAAVLGEEVVVMTTSGACETCRRIDASLRDSLMQTALADARLVRVDIDVFKEDLDELKMQWDRVPAFFLLAPDLMPKDGIDGGEWDADVAQNIAPVLGAFVKGQLKHRKRSWEPLPGSGIRL